MAKGTEIIVSANPQGKFLEGIITDTSKPGMIMELVPATAAVGGRFSWRARSTTAGSKGLIAVLMPDSLQGKLGVGAAANFGLLGGGGGANDAALPGDAYVANTRGFLYCPIAGEELNLLVANQAGTADDIAIGDRFGIDATGKLKADSSYTSCPFRALEAVTDPTADYMAYMMYDGNNA